jgi:hypothetical protein
MLVRETVVKIHLDRLPEELVSDIFGWMWRPLSPDQLQHCVRVYRDRVTVDGEYKQIVKIPCPSCDEDYYGTKRNEDWFELRSRHPHIFVPTVIIVRSHVPGSGEGLSTVLELTHPFAAELVQIRELQAQPKTDTVLWKLVMEFQRLLIRMVIERRAEGAIASPAQLVELTDRALYQEMAAPYLAALAEQAHVLSV